MYKITFDKNAEKDLNKLQLSIQKRILKKLKDCQQNPFRYLEHLENIKGYKLKVGDYRIIMDVDTRIKILSITKIKHRKNVYIREDEEEYSSNPT